MTFKFDPKTYLLKFGPNDEFSGLEITVKSISIKQFFTLMKLSGDVASVGADKSMENADNVAKAVGSVDAMVSAFSDALISWNLVDGDERPIPCSRETVDQLPSDMVLRLANKWIEVVGGMSQDLGKGSDSGATYPEVPIPMALA